MNLPLKRIVLTLSLLTCVQAQAVTGFEQASRDYNSGNYALALKQLRPLATAGDADSQYLLGLMYYIGQGVEQDYQKAANWFKLAVAHADARADCQYLLGAMHYTGRGIPQDYKMAVTLFTKASQQGHAEAQHLLGLMYLYHVGGLPKDSVLAYMLWNLAAAGGSEAAVDLRMQLAKRLRPEQIEEAQSLSTSWQVGTPLPSKSRTGTME
jgi:TPR repeat protein